MESHGDERLLDFYELQRILLGHTKLPPKVKLNRKCDLEY